jgi:hypothetical protein
MRHEADTDAGAFVTPRIVEAIAQRVAELLRAELGLTPCLLTPSEVADRFAVSRTWVYEHATELGAIRLGDGPKARLRFDAKTVSEVLGGDAKRAAEATEHERQVRRRASNSTSLLPIHGVSDGQ